MGTSRRSFLRGASAGALALAACGRGAAARPDPRPNILFALADDWSWPQSRGVHDPVLEMPTYERLAREGVVFRNAYVSSPSCTPSRGAMLTGQYHWRLEQGGNFSRRPATTLASAERAGGLGTSAEGAERETPPETVTRTSGPSWPLDPGARLSASGSAVTTHTEAIPSAAACAAEWTPRG